MRGLLVMGDVSWDPGLYLLLLPDPDLTHI
jgi:hypothetical protein